MLKNKKKIATFNSTRIVFLGFAGVILLATLLLMLPASSASGEGTNFVDAMFTATTSVCVTGLVVVPTYAHWSLLGKLIIFVLIQLGGLGVVCITMGFFILIRKRISLKERKLIQESYNLDQVDGMVKTVLEIFKATFVIEGIGAVLYSVRFIPKYGFVKGICFSIFHSVSAFCNAGLDLIGENSLADYSNDWYFMIVTMLLIVSGGLGFVVWWEIIKLIKRIRNKQIQKNKFFERMTIHSKFVILLTVIFIVSGALIVYVMECNNPDTLGEMPAGKKILAAIFESVTLRTAGFSTFSQTGLKDATFIIVCLFMLVGGSPMGTAGGIKTTTIGIIAVEVISVVRGKKRAELFHRSISTENVQSALSVACISAVVVFIGIIGLTITEDCGLRQVVFEAFSAIGTVGISMDFTAALSTAGRLIIIALMFLGRIGPITMVMAFAAKRNAAPDRDYPEKRILIG